jgi:DNA-binding response OmpR family regulator
MADLIAVVDRDDAVLVRTLASLVDGGRVRIVARAVEAEHLAGAGRVDAVVFDPAVAGTDFLQAMRRAHPAQVVVAWTAGSSSQTVAALLESGADEVVHGGMSEREIVARMRAVLRHARRPTALSLELGPLVLDSAHGEATWHGRDLLLTRREREVLEVLAENAGRTVRRELLYRRVWGYAMARGERSVDVNVKRLRRKLALIAGDELQIKTQPGVGYRLELVADRATAPVTAL